MEGLLIQGGSQSLWPTLEHTFICRAPHAALNMESKRTSLIYEDGGYSRQKNYLPGSSKTMVTRICVLSQTL